MAKYKVKLKFGYPYGVRRIADLVIDAEGYEGELTADQVKEIKADSDYLTISPAGKKEAPESDAPVEQVAEPVVEAPAETPADAPVEQVAQ